MVPAPVSRAITSATRRGPDVGREPCPRGPAPNPGLRGRGQGPSRPYLTVRFDGASSVLPPVPPPLPLEARAVSRVVKFTPGSVPSDPRFLNGEVEARA